jgi:hypothetical protein
VYTRFKLGSTHSLILLAILLLAAFLRFHALAQDLRFHADEALFATFSRNAALNGQWMLPGALDKPPLTIYMMALSMSFAARGSTDTLLDFDVRQGEFAARVPNVFGSILLVAVAYALAKQIYKRRDMALIAALLMTCSPLLVGFSASAFTDIYMLLGMTLALWMAAAKRPLWAGIFLAISFASKQQALFYAPLILGILLLQSVRYVDASQANQRPKPLQGFSKPLPRRFQLLATTTRFVIPLILMLIILLLWDAARAQSTGLFALATANNSPTGLVPLNEIPARVETWLGYGSSLLGVPLITLLLMVIAFVAFITRPSRIDALLWGYIVLYSFAHWFIHLNIYDRYLLLLLPLCVLVSARGIFWFTSFCLSLSVRWRKGERIFSPSPLPHIHATSQGSAGERGLGGEVSAKTALLILAFSLILLIGAYPASEGHLIGGRADDSILNLADYLNQQTLGAIIYDRWLGWELGYYLGQWTDKRKVYFPTINLLVEGALAQPDPAPRYFVTPRNRLYQPWLDALRAAGFQISLVYNESPYLVFRLNPSWAVSDA